VAVIGFVPHMQRPSAVSLADRCAEWLREAGHQARIFAELPDAQWGGVDQLVADLDLAVSLGGDGTMLRTVDLVMAAQVPVLGVNVGHLGYLTVVGPEDLEDALARFLAGDYRLEARMTIELAVTRRGAEEPFLVVNALNDAVLQRVTGGHTVRVAVSVGGEPFLTYAADSMILATPTGSTAYNLSARGPIVSPRARVLLLTPVAAHMLFDRSLVFDATEALGVEVIDSQAELVVDGRSIGVLGRGDALSCRTGGRDALLVGFGERDFHHLLKQKFGLSDR
jgi:NAD+ kinase